MTRLSGRWIAAIGITMAILGAAALGVRREYQAPPAAAAPSPDGQRDELARCRGLGAAAAQDRSCLDTWAENRRRFFAPGGAVARPKDR